MALFSECMQRCGKKGIDRAGVVRDAISREYEVLHSLVAERLRRGGRLAAIHFVGKFGSFLISRICWMWRSACVEISNIHCQQSITSRSPKLWARMSSLVVLM